MVDREKLLTERARLVAEWKILAAAPDNDPRTDFYIHGRVAEIDNILVEDADGTLTDIKQE